MLIDGKEKCNVELQDSDHTHVCIRDKGHDLRKLRSGRMHLCDCGVLWHPSIISREVEGKAVAFIGQDSDSFKRLLEDLKPILRAAIRALPNEEELRDKLRIAIGNTIDESKREVA